MDYHTVQTWFKALKEANPNYNELDKFDALFDLKKYRDDELLDQFKNLLIDILSESVDLKTPEGFNIKDFFNPEHPYQFWTTKEEADENKKEFASTIKTIVKNLEAHLANKMQKEGFVPTYENDLSDESFVNLSDSEEYTPAQRKLITRYDAIFKLNKQIGHKSNLDESDIQTAKVALDTCLKNKPDWSERPFLQQLTDILSFGFKALYRAFFSNESKLEEKLDKSLSSPKPRV
jgi:hypothetical protein